VVVSRDGEGEGLMCRVFGRFDTRSDVSIGYSRFAVGQERPRKARSGHAEEVRNGTSRVKCAARNKDESFAYES
jgi:hypothetical protein